MSTQPTNPEQPGDLLGSYQLLRLLGEGSMGRVFEARHTGIGREVAIKVLRPEHARDDKLIERFFREAKAVNQINHRHIVEVFDFVDAASSGSERAYCVMERLDGKTLAELFESGELTLLRSVAILRQVCEALQAAHEVGVVHRDLKPDNIVVVERQGADFAKVLDFGVAKLLTPDPTTQATVDGAIVGTPQYMAPEQAASLEVDARADVYGVGCLLYQALTSHPPFRDEALGQLLVQIITQPPEPLGPRTANGEQIPEALASLVMSCLEKDPLQRPQTMAELHRRLAPFADIALLDRARRVERNTRLLVAVAAAMVVTGGVLMLPPSAGEDASAIAVGTPASEAPSSPRVHVEIRTTPLGAAVIRADTGERLGTTPVTLSFARIDGELPVRLELDGHAPLERTVRLTRDVSLEVELSRAVPVNAVVKDRGTAKDRVIRDAVVDPFAQ